MGVAVVKSAVVKVTRKTIRDEESTRRGHSANSHGASHSNGRTHEPIYSNWNSDPSRRDDARGADTTHGRADLRWRNNSWAKAGAASRPAS
jgi:hypothetical protein